MAAQEVSIRQSFQESGCLGMQQKMGSRFYLRLIKIWKPIAKKYSDGKVKRTLKKGLKGLEMVKRERHKIIQ